MLMLFISTSELCGLLDAHPAADWWSLGAILFEILTGKVQREGYWWCIQYWDYLALVAVATYMLCCTASNTHDVLQFCIVKSGIVYTVHCVLELSCNCA